MALLQIVHVLAARGELLPDRVRDHRHDRPRINHRVLLADRGR